MISSTELPLRFIITAQLLAIGIVRAYFGAPRGREASRAGAGAHSESAWLTGALGMIAVLHFGAILSYLVNPSLLRWSEFEVGEPMRWIGIVISSLGVAGENLGSCFTWSKL